MLTGKKYIVKKATRADKKADIQIERWYNENYMHFVLRERNKDGSTSIWDSLGKFHLKQRGYNDIESYRLFYLDKD
jgi:hypothetical protein